MYLGSAALLCTGTETAAGIQPAEAAAAAVAAAA